MTHNTLMFKWFHDDGITGIWHQPPVAVFPRTKTLDKSYEIVYIRYS
jgi:hypothetical protein